MPRETRWHSKERRRSWASPGARTRKLVFGDVGGRQDVLRGRPPNVARGRRLSVLDAAKSDVGQRFRKHLCVDRRCLAARGRARPHEIRCPAASRGARPHEIRCPAASREARPREIRWQAALSETSVQRKAVTLIGFRRRLSPEGADRRRFSWAARVETGDGHHVSVGARYRNRCPTPPWARSRYRKPVTDTASRWSAPTESGAWHRFERGRETKCNDRHRFGETS